MGELSLIATAGVPEGGIQEAECWLCGHCDILCGYVHRVAIRIRFRLTVAVYGCRGSGPNCDQRSAYRSYGQAGVFTWRICFEHNR
jgi:hypothetical protein